MLFLFLASSSCFIYFIDCCLFFIYMSKVKSFYESDHRPSKELEF
jgi:hypothetical protein